jgi:hypothetical protein
LTGFYDAGIGNYLEGDGAGNFKSVPVAKSGFFVDGDAKALARLTLPDGDQLLIATQNRGSIKVFRQRAKFSAGKTGKAVVGPLSNSAIVHLKNGKKRKHEFYYGSGYLTSSSRQPASGHSIVKMTVSKERAQ